MRIISEQRISKQMVNLSKIDLFEIAKVDISKSVAVELLKFIPIERNKSLESIQDYFVEIELHIYRESTMGRIISLIKELNMTMMTTTQHELFLKLKEELKSNYSELENKNLFT
jgi:hypothetical protein